MPAPPAQPANAVRRRRFWRRTVLIAVVVAAIGMCGPVAHAETVVLALAPSVHAVLDNIRNWIMGVLAALATVFLTVGGVRYLIAGGDPGEVAKAKQAFSSAAFGYGLAAVAPLIVEILKGIVGER